MSDIDETEKAFFDAVIFGRGFTRIDRSGIEHIPYHVALAMQYTIICDVPGTADDIEYADDAPETYEWPHRSL